jgi:hypothetical protein
MSLNDRYIAAMKARWDPEALRDGQLVWQLWWDEKSLDLHAIKSVSWRTGGDGGSIRIEMSVGSELIGLKEFLRRDRLELVRLLRRLIAEDAQSSWPEFCRCIAWPLLRSFEPPRESQPGDICLSRGRWDVIGGIGTAMTAGVAYFVWQATGNAGAFVAVLLVVALWLLLRFSSPKEGGWISADRDPPGQKSLIIALHIGMFGGAPFVGLSNRWLGPDAHPIVALLVPLAIWGIALLPAAAVWRYYAPVQRAWKERKTVEALAEWLHREPPPETSLAAPVR